MRILEQIITFLLIWLLGYQIFLAHFRLKIVEGYMLVLPAFNPVFSLTTDPVVKPTAIPVNNFYPKTHFGMDFDPNSVITQIT
jgi:hypothetical protein